MNNDLDIFSRRAGFNVALRHFKFTTSLIKPISMGIHPADLIWNALADETITKAQILPSLSALLVDKFEYSFLSQNSTHGLDDCQEVCKTLSSWNALQIVVVYHHPEMGVCVINPCNPESWKDVLPIKKNELIVVYIHSPNLSSEILNQATKDVHTVLTGKKVKGCKEYQSTEKRQELNTGSVKNSSPEIDRTKPKTQNYRITPKYSVLVTNELFHNGNVEAWKRIIASYHSTYEDLEVMVYYDGERINDLNALFKWGKVKHGTPILISIGGSEIKDVSKLQRYLFEGASPRFESFLKGRIDQPLELF